MDKLSVDVGLRGSELDVDLVSSELGVLPTRMFRTGEEYQSRSGKVMIRPWSVWAFGEVHQGESLNVENILRSFVERTKLWLPKLRSFSSEGIRCSAAIHWEPDDGAGGYSIDSKSLIQLVSAVNEVDFYFS